MAIPWLKTYKGSSTEWQGLKELRTVVWGSGKVGWLPGFPNPTEIAWLFLKSLPFDPVRNIEQALAHLQVREDENLAKWQSTLASPTITSPYGD